jgi:hypothetical protein
MKALITVTAVISAVFVAAPAVLADPFITDTLGGNGNARGYHITTDTLGGNGHPKFVTDIPISAEAYRFAAYADTLARGGSPAPAVGYRFITDTLAPGGGMVVSAPVTGGFGWSDAGIGAAVTASLMLLLLGIVRVMQQHRRRLLAA